MHSESATYDFSDSLYETIKELYEKLKPKGYLVILVPNKDSYLAQRYKKLWHGLDTRHLHLPTEAGISSLCQRIGFKINKKEEFSFPNDLSATLVQVIFGRFNKLFFYLFLIPALILTQAKWKRLKSTIRFILIKK